MCDVILQQDNRTHTVLDLDDLGQAYTLGVITADEMVQILADTQRLIDEIRTGAFPPSELQTPLNARDSNTLV